MMVNMTLMRSTVLSAKVPQSTPKWYPLRHLGFILFCEMLVLGMMVLGRGLYTWEVEDVDFWEKLS